MVPMASARFWLACATLAAAFAVHAQGAGTQGAGTQGAGAQGAGASSAGTVWKCVEPDGRAHYTNIKKETDGKNCTIVTKEVSVVPAAQAPRQTPSAATPPNF